MWTASQTAQFLYSIDWHRLYAAFHLMALRGLRRGETAGLRRVDIDLEKATLTIRFQNQRRDGELVICPPKTNGSQRTVALDSITVTALRLHRERQPRELRDLKMPDSGYVFTDTQGLPMSVANLGEQFRRLVRLSGLPPVRLHDLRHGAASLALASRVDLKSICDQLGHSSIVVTADTYVTVLPELALRAAQRVAELILSHGIKVPGTHRTRHYAEPAETVIRMPSQALAA